MPLSSGTRLGPYEIVAPLGAGGMGEVYRALDSRLGREVAVKVLPPHLASTPEARARFDREARTISQLNFPSICTLFDVGHQDGLDYLVMELVEGETLARRLARGALPMSDVLAYGRQVAEALDRAHRAGVIHRDLKPGNIMLTRTGAKLMDFGLARTAGMAGSASGLTQSPTAAAPLTAEGTIVGTFQYMAPEQLEGKEADARSDLWALGCVLYEMATGKRAFEGDSQASLIGAIMRDVPPPLAERVPAAPPPLGRLVGALLAKSPDERVQTAHDVKLQLQWAAEPGSGAASPAGAPAPAARRDGALAWGVAAVATAVAIAAGAFVRLGREEGIGPVVSAIEPPADVHVSTNAGMPIGISPDGSRLVFVGHQGDGPDRLWVRPLGKGEAKELPGTEGPSFPFFSPDGRAIAFFTDNALMRVNVDGGPTTKITDCFDTRGGTWGRDDRIVYAPTGQGGLFVVDAGGGTPRPATQLDTSLKETTHRFPHFLPDGRHYLYLARRGGAGQGENPVIYMAQLDRPGRKEVVSAASNVAYSSGHLLYVEKGTLVAQPFDPASGATRGPARPISDQVTMDERFSRGSFVASRNGVLAYQTGKAPLTSRLLWKDRRGAVLQQVGGPETYTFGGMPVLDPTGQRALIGMFSEERGLSDVWLVDTRTGNPQRMSVDNEDHYSYCWVPGGRTIVVNTLLGGNQSVLHERAVDGAAGSRQLFRSPSYLYPTSVSPDGRWLLFDSGDTSKVGDVKALPLRESGPPMTISAGRAFEANGAFSPDGRFVAYESDESGRGEVYVVPFPPNGAKWQVSARGGSQAAWNSDGSEIFYLDPQNMLNAVAVRIAGGSLEASPPQPLFQIYGSSPLSQHFDVAPGGQRFLVSIPVAAESPVTLVTDWVKTLGR